MAKNNATLKEEALEKQLSERQILDYVFTPGRYVGLPDEEDDFNFAERFGALKTELEEQLQEEARLNEVIRDNLKKIKV